VPNLWIIHRNDADQATSLAASTTAGALVAAYMQTDLKGQAHRSTGTSVTYTLTWTGGVTIGAVALPATNLTSAATIRVRLFSDTACTALLQDSGAITACPGLAAAPWTWTATYNANAFAYGYLSKAVAWFESQQAGVKGLKIDLADATNPAGYIDCARLIAGPWWAPKWGAEYGCTTLVVDNSTNARTDAGDLPSDRAPMHQELTLTLPWLSETERSQLMQILRANGVWKPVFVSLMPRAGTAATQDNMIYGKRKNSPLTAAYFDRFSHALELESW
jgi:hypothetical protein